MELQLGLFCILETISREKFQDITTLTPSLSHDSLFSSKKLKDFTTVAPVQCWLLPQFKES
jgi:hypothetical protein